MTINEYFDKVFLINVAARKDRLEHAYAEASKHRFTFERFDAYLPFEVCGRVEVNAACTASHRALLEVTAYHKWNRVLILEDDFEIVVPNFEESFTAFVTDLPDDWEMAYLGGGFQADPQYRVSPNVVRTNGICTTSSYAVKWQSARKIAPHICGIGPIDCLYYHFNETLQTYIATPRMIVQMEGFSDIQGRVMANHHSMLDPHHLARLAARPNGGYR